MTKSELVMDVLTGMGLRPKIDNDGDVAVMYQMKTMCVLIGDDDDKYLSVMLPQFSEVSEDDVTLALVACNKITRSIKWMKMYVDCSLKTVSATCEFFYDDDNDVRANLHKALEILGLARSIYRNEKEELQN